MEWCSCVVITNAKVHILYLQPLQRTHISQTRVLNNLLNTHALILTLLLPGVLLVTRNQTVKRMEIKLLHQLLPESNTLVTIPIVIQTGRERADPHHTRDNSEDTSTDSGFRWKSDLKREFTTVIIHPATRHHGQAALNCVRREELLPSQRTYATVSKGGRNDSQGISVD